MTAWLSSELNLRATRHFLPYFLNAPSHPAALIRHDTARSRTMCTFVTDGTFDVTQADTRKARNADEELSAVILQVLAGSVGAWLRAIARLSGIAPITLRNQPPVAGSAGAWLRAIARLSGIAPITLRIQPPVAGSAGAADPGGTPRVARVKLSRHSPLAAPVTTEN